MTFSVKSPKKLIEVALPLDAINDACAYEKMPGIGAHPRGIHLWWARRPLAAARAVIFSQLVNDPSWKWELENSGQIPPCNLKASWAASRKRLFKVIEELVLWENSTNEAVLERARTEIRRSWREVCELNKEHPEAAELFNPDKLPGLHDPFAGGGAIPLEAQRLGLEAYASDLNPVAVLINKAMIEIPPKFSGRPPIGPKIEETKKTKEFAFSQSWPGVTGLVEDIYRYGAVLRDEAISSLGDIYPPAEVTSDMAIDRPDLLPLVGKKLPVVAWLWARTVKSPNPAFSHIDVPLTASFVLSTKTGKESYIEPIVVGNSYSFKVRMGKIPDEAKRGTKLSRGANFRCLLSNTPIEPRYIKEQGMAHRMGERLMAIIAVGPKGRVFLPPTQGTLETLPEPEWLPEGKMIDDARAFTPHLYGLSRWSDLFTQRQMVVLTKLSDLVETIRERVYTDACKSGMEADGRGLDDGGSEARAYSEAISVYLAFALSRLADFGCSLATWKPSGEQVMHVFTRQALGMTWDFPESNLLGDRAICLTNAVKYTAEGLAAGAPVLMTPGYAQQADAQNQKVSQLKFISTDPPYYDNVPYADLSDFFYVWVRKALRTIFPAILSTVEVPKAEELVASSYRHGGGKESEAFFLKGMTEVIHNLAEQAHPEGPVTIYYAFKQSETNDSSTSSTGWDTFLTAVLSAGFSIVGTWPLRSEQEYRIRGMGANALASSIVLVCRRREKSALTISRREFLRELNAVLPEALDEMTKGSGDDRSPVAPVDLSQSIIGPGMAVFSKYAAVLEADGSPMSVRSALQLINRFLAEDDFDPDTQFCLHWFEQNGWKEGRFGDAETLSRAKGTSVDGVRDAGVIESGGGIVRLRKWSEYPSDWDPQTDTRNPVWETLHHLIRALRQQGESGAGLLLAEVKPKAEATRQLAYRLYTLCERQGWAEDARAYNELITSWAGIESAASEAPEKPTQGTLFV